MKIDTNFRLKIEDTVQKAVENILAFDHRNGASRATIADVRNAVVEGISVLLVELEVREIEGCQAL